jgi:hypothetical protein
MLGTGKVESVAVYITVVIPRGKAVPLGGLLTIVTGPIPPEAVAVPRIAAETTPEHTFGSVLTTISGGAVMVRGATTVSVNGEERSDAITLCPKGTIAPTAHTLQTYVPEERGLAVCDIADSPYAV